MTEELGFDYRQREAVLVSFKARGPALVTNPFPTECAPGDYIQLELR